MTSTATPVRGRGVYVHVPFCRRRCPYCDFAIEVGVDSAGFVDAVIAEASARGVGVIDGVGVVDSVSLGGGTPSSLVPPELSRLLARFAGALRPGAEVSLEVNPEDITVDVARGLRDAGFTRVSVGLQSFSDPVLRYLGRAHSGDAGAVAVAALVDVGVDVGVDLIVGVPGEGPTRLADDLARAAGLGVAHVSTYLLTLEEGTPLVSLIARGKRAAIDDDAQADAYEAVQGLCAGQGFRQYEVSSFARPGHESRHNRLYWQRGDYLGLGPGAHSFFIDVDGRAQRRHNRARFADYRKDPMAGAEHETLEPAHALLEAIAFGLRDKLHGVDVDVLAAWHKTAVPAGLARVIARAVDAGDVVVVEGRAFLTDQGVRFADRVARAVLALDAQV